MARVTPLPQPVDADQPSSHPVSVPGWEETQPDGAVTVPGGAGSAAAFESCASGEDHPEHAAARQSAADAAGKPGASTRDGADGGGEEGKHGRRGDNLMHVEGHPPDIALAFCYVTDAMEGR